MFSFFFQALQLTVNSVAVDTLSGTPLTPAASGQVGLSLGSIATSANSASFGQQSIAQVQVQGGEPQISFCMTRTSDLSPNVVDNPANTTSVFGGFLTFGGNNASLYTGAPENYPLVGNDTLWNLNMTSEFVDLRFLFFLIIYVVSKNSHYCARTKGFTQRTGHSDHGYWYSPDRWANWRR